MNAREIPPAALRDGDAVELLRVWIAEQGLHCSMKIGMYADEGASAEIAAWGVILADLAQHVADALSAEGLGARADLLEGIVENFNEEVSSPTSERIGQAAPKAS
jgi:hypothetical protein